jgi:DNA-binding beta-propeller fold protein YncE
MARVNSSGNGFRGIVVLVLLVLTAGVLVVVRSAGTSGILRQPHGYPQLLSVETLPDGGEMCDWVPARAGSTLMAAIEKQRTAHISSDAAPSAAAPTDASRAEVARRKPIRTIKDPWGAFSAVAIDPAHNEVVMTDENLFSVVAYDRLENTPPKATMSEPKRRIQGKNTDIEFQCSLYVDPTNGDIYAVNNDTLGKLVIFSHQARGDAAPDRYLVSPQSTFGIAVDEKTQEMMLTVQDDAAVVTFQKQARNLDSPVRTLQGVHTGLADPHGIAFDPEKDRIFVTNWGTVNEHKMPASGKIIGTLGRGIGRTNWPIGWNDAVPGSGTFLPPSITVYPRAASGDTLPLQTIQGSQTQLNWPTALVVDYERNELYVANDPANSVLVFPADATGDVAPIRVLKGPQTLLQNPTSVFLDRKNNELWVANFGNHTATVYERGAGGDSAPRRVIRSGPLDAPAPMMGNPHTVAYDSKRDELLVAN